MFSIFYPMACVAGTSADIVPQLGGVGIDVIQGKLKRLEQPASGLALRIGTFIIEIQPLARFFLRTGFANLLPCLEVTTMDAFSKR
jgi:hypothetical protein